LKLTMIKDRRVKDLAYTLGANIISFMAGLLITFVIPKLISIEEFAYFRAFTLYLGYLGVFHFGFNDGVYVNYGKYDFENLPKEKFRTYFKFLFVFQSIMAILLFAVASALSKDKSSTTIYFFLCINIVLANLIAYFDSISQFVRRFKVYSFNLTLSKILYSLGILAFFFINNNKGAYFIALQTLINCIMVCIYVVRYKDIVFGKSEVISVAKKDIIKNISVGFFIMIGNFVTIIIIGIDRMFVQRFFSEKDFGIYSFAVSLLSMFYLVLNSITAVVYPYLTRSEGRDKGKVYEVMKTAIFVLVGFCLSGYFVFDIIVRMILPQYVEALKITAIIFPTILLSAEINIVTQNFYKTMRLQREYTRNNMVAMVLAIISVAVAYLIFKTTTAIGLSSLIYFYLWGLYGDNYFKKVLGIKVWKHHIAEVLAIVAFIYLATKVVWYIAFPTYIAIFAIIVFILFRKDISEIKNMLLKRS